MSFRQISLAKLVEELKAELERKKTERERSMEKEIIQLQEKYTEKQSNIRQL